MTSELGGGVSVREHSECRSRRETPGTRLKSAKTTTQDGSALAHANAAPNVVDPERRVMSLGVRAKSPSGRHKPRPYLVR